MGLGHHHVTEFDICEVKSKALDEHCHQVAREFNALFVQHMPIGKAVTTKRVSLPDIHLHYRMLEWSERKRSKPGAVCLANLIINPITPSDCAKCPAGLALSTPGHEVDPQAVKP